MILFPAIDLKNGSCVRLVQGKMEDATIFNENPVDQAKYFESKGCKWIHIVDLDGAFQGKPVNEETIKKIISSVNIKIQLGGGIRNMQSIDKWFASGIERLVLGSLIVTNPILVKEFWNLMGINTLDDIDRIKLYKNYDKKN